MTVTLTRRLWYTADRSQVVPDGDTRAAFLLGPAGAAISDEEAARLGLKGTEPPLNKATAPGANKGGLSFETEVKGSEGAPIDGDALPDDFPAVEFLRAAGLATHADVRGFIADGGRLTDLAGIGKTYAGKIRSAL